jgi:16S rRNA (cytosine1402-N4)-methyltransferase
VKQFFKEGKRQGLYQDVARDVIRPSKEECFINPRAHSTKLRWAIVSDMNN